MFRRKYIYALPSQLTCAAIVSMLHVRRIDFDPVGLVFIVCAQFLFSLFFVIAVACLLCCPQLRGHLSPRKTCIEMVSLAIVGAVSGAWLAMAIFES